MREFTYPIPTDAGSVDLTALHARIEAAGLDFDGVSVAGDSIVIAAEDSPDGVVKALDWNAVTVAPPVEEVVLPPETIKAALKVALSGTSAQKAAFVRDHLS